MHALNSLEGSSVKTLEKCMRIKMLVLVIYFLTSSLCKYICIRKSNDQIVNLATVNKQSDSNNVVRKPTSPTL